MKRLFQFRLPALLLALVLLLGLLPGTALALQPEVQQADTVGTTNLSTRIADLSAQISALSPSSISIILTRLSVTFASVSFPGCVVIVRQCNACGGA